MKRDILSPVATAVAIASTAVLVSACGSSGGGGSTSPAIGVAGVGCATLATTMGFQATNAYIDSANIYAVPGGEVE